MPSFWPFSVIVAKKEDDENIVLRATDDGKLKVEATVDVTSSGSAIQDGVDGDIKATVKDYITGDPAKSNPLAVQLTDTSGTPINPGSGGTSLDYGDPFPITGTAIGFEDAAGDMAPVVLEADGSLPVTIVGGGGGGGAVTIADGADVTQGALNDASVTGDNNGTLSAKIRGLNTMFADVWSAADNWFRVKIENTTLAVTQSGSWVLSAGSAIIGNVRIDQTTPGTTNGVVVATALPAGNNNIGDVDVASVAGNVTVVQGTGSNLHTVVDSGVITTVSAVTAIINALPAGTNNIGDVDVATQIGAANVANNQVSVGTTSGGDTIAASRATRRSITIVNGGTTDVFVGVGTVSTTNGVLLVGVKGAAITLNVTAAIKGIVGAGSQTVSYFEEYD